MVITYGNKFYVFDCNKNIVKEKLYREFEVLNTWFYDNYVALNFGKFNCLVSNLLVDQNFVYEKYNGE